MLLPMRLSISAAALDAAQRGLASCCRCRTAAAVSTSFSSFSAAGWMPSSVAMRSSTSLRWRSVKQLQHRRRLVAVEVDEDRGDDLRMLVAHQLGDRRRRPSTSGPRCRWRRRPAGCGRSAALALSSPSALRQHRADVLVGVGRRGSFCSAATVPNISSTSSRRSRGTTSCARSSRRCSGPPSASRCLKTSAASSSPSDISRIAAFSRPTSFTVRRRLSASRRLRRRPSRARCRRPRPGSAAPACAPLRAGAPAVAVRQHLDLRQGLRIVDQLRRRGCPAAAGSAGASAAFSAGRTRPKKTSSATSDSARRQRRGAQQIESPRAASTSGHRPARASRP